LRRLQSDFYLGQLADPTNMTVEAWLGNWLENTARVKTSPTTYQRYEQLVRLHIRPHIGMVKLEKLAPVHVHSLMGALERAGESAWTRKMTASVLHNALHQAVRLRFLVHNPCADIPRARPGEREMQVLTEAQVKAFLAAAG